MLAQPTSSPMMKTMLGFALAGWECATGATAAAQIDTNPTQPMRRKDSLVNIAASLPGCISTVSRMSMRLNNHFDAPDASTLIKINAARRCRRYARVMDVNVRLLRYALTLARHRHFGRAARALDISQPALSRGIAALEREFGVRIFERSRRDVTATRAGEDVLKMADELVNKIDVFSSRLSLVRDGRVTRLRVASSAYIHDIAVRPAAALMVKANPSVRLELLEREW